MCRTFTFIKHANNKVAAESIVSPWDDPVMGTRSDLAHNESLFSRLVLCDQHLYIHVSHLYTFRYGGGNSTFADEVLQIPASLP